jgi:hypothetical protein
MSFQCICNAYTASADVPIVFPNSTTAVPSESANSTSPATTAPTEDEDKSNPSPGGGDEPGVPGLPNEAPDDPNDECQIWNPDSDYWSGAPHPFQAVADGTTFETCFAGNECAQGWCCVLKYCLCEPITDSAFCLSGFEA